MVEVVVVVVVVVIIIITRCYVKANSFVQFLCPKFVLTYVEFALTSSRYSYGINPIVGICLNVEYMLVYNNNNNNNDNNNNDYDNNNVNNNNNNNNNNNIIIIIMK